MIENNDIFEKAKRQFFVDKFVPALDEWKEKNKDKGGTQEAFAKLIGVSENMIKKYKSGVIPREETLNRIITAFGVPDDYFVPTTKTERYKYSPEYMTDLGETEILPYCEEIGLDPKFLRVISDLIGESLGEQFPFWTPITINPINTWFFNPDNMYRRPDPVEFWSSSAEMQPDIKMFQIEAKKRDGSEEKKRITLSYSDLLFLRDVQDEVRDYIEFLFLKRKKEMKKECEEACQRAQTKLPDGGTSVGQLKAEELNKIDKYCSRYVDNKVKNEKIRRKKNGND